MKRFGLLVILLAAISAAVSAQNQFAPSGSLNGSRIVDLERQAFDLMNERRMAAGQSPLRWSDDLLPVARGHSQNMANFKFFNHRGKDGSMVDDRADRSGLGLWQAIGENIAFNRGYANPVEFAIERWMMSPKHRDNMLNKEWSETAVGIAIAEDGSYYFTQVFLLR